MLEVVIAGPMLIITYKAPTPDALNMDRYRWTNLVLEDPFPPQLPDGSLAQAPYTDPPLGGFGYEHADYSPFYYDDNDCAECPQNMTVENYWNEDFSVFKFKDAPTVPGLKVGERVYFRTCLWDTIENKALACEEWYKDFRSRLYHVNKQ